MYRYRTGMPANTNGLLAAILRPVVTGSAHYLTCLMCSHSSSASKPDGVEKERCLRASSFVQLHPASTWSSHSLPPSSLGSLAESRKDVFGLRALHVLSPNTRTVELVTLSSSFRIDPSREGAARLASSPVINLASLHFTGAPLVWKASMLRCFTPHSPWRSPIATSIDWEVTLDTPALLTHFPLHARKPAFLSVS